MALTLIWTSLFGSFYSQAQKKEGPVFIDGFPGQAIEVLSPIGTTLSTDALTDGRIQSMSTASFENKSLEEGQVVSAFGSQGPFMAYTVHPLPNTKDGNTKTGDHASCTHPSAGFDTQLVSESDLQKISQLPESAETKKTLMPSVAYPKPSSKPPAQPASSARPPTQANTDLNSSALPFLEEFQTEAVPSVFRTERRANDQLSTELEKEMRANERQTSETQPIDRGRTQDLIEIFKLSSRTQEKAQDTVLKERSNRHIDATLEREQERIREVNFDQNQVRLSYLEKPASTMKSSFERSYQESQLLVDQLNQAQGKLPESQRRRYLKLAQNAADQARQGIETINQYPDFFNSNLSLSQLQQAAKSNEDKKAIEAISPFIGGTQKNEEGDTEQALSKRMMLFNGLSKDQRAQQLQSLRNHFNLQTEGTSSSSSENALLHNGGILELEEKAVSCQRFITQVLPVHLRKNGLSSYSLWGISQYLKQGFFPEPPQWQAPHLEKLKTIAPQFERIDHERGERILPGDLLVHLIPGFPNGKVYLIKSIDLKSYSTEVIEFKRATKSNYEVKSFPLSFDPVQSQHRFFRAGLNFLRIKDQLKKDCQISMAKRGDS